MTVRCLLLEQGLLAANTVTGRAFQKIGVDVEGAVLPESTADLVDLQQRVKDWLRVPSNFIEKQRVQDRLNDARVDPDTYMVVAVVPKTYSMDGVRTGGERSPLEASVERLCTTIRNASGIRNYCVILISFSSEPMDMNPDLGSFGDGLLLGKVVVDYNGASTAVSIAKGFAAGFASYKSSAKRARYFSALNWILIAVFVPLMAGMSSGIGLGLFESYFNSTATTTESEKSELPSIDR